MFARLGSRLPRFERNCAYENSLELRVASRLIPPHTQRLSGLPFATTALIQIPLLRPKGKASAKSKEQLGAVLDSSERQ